VNVPRLIYAGWRFHVKSLTLSSFFILLSIISPIIFASMAYFMFRAGARPGSLLYVSLGAAMMGIWSSTLFGSGGAIQWQRWQGTLEFCIASPPPFILILVPLTLATATVGLYSLVATLTWGWIFFDVPFTVEHPVQFVVALPAMVTGLGLLGLVLASTFVLWRNANALSNLLEYPVWIASGLIFSTSILPDWTHPISWALPPYWGVLAVRHAALGGEVWHPLLMLAVLGAISIAISAYTFRLFEHLARARATLSLT
jgi:ABC-2 type transport system permease protein